MSAVPKPKMSDRKINLKCLVVFFHNKVKQTKQKIAFLCIGFKVKYFF